MKYSTFNKILSSTIHLTSLPRNILTTLTGNTAYVERNSTAFVEKI